MHSIGDGYRRFEAGEQGAAIIAADRQTNESRPSMVREGVFETRSPHPRRQRLALPGFPVAAVATPRQSAKLPMSQVNLSNSEASTTRMRATG